MQLVCLVLSIALLFQLFLYQSRSGLLLLPFSWPAYIPAFEGKKKDKRYNFALQDMSVMSPLSGCIFKFSYFFCVCVYGAGDQTKGFPHARQIHYHWGIFAAPFTDTFKICWILLSLIFFCLHGFSLILAALGSVFVYCCVCGFYLDLSFSENQVHGIWLLAAFGWIPVNEKMLTYVGCLYGKSYFTI